MKYLIPTSDNPYYLWQVLVQARAFRDLGEHGIWLIYYDNEPSPLLREIVAAGIGEVHVMRDWARDRSYNPAMKPWVIGRYLAAHPEPGPVALFDPDAIPTRKMTLVPEAGVLQGSDTDSYTGPGYLKHKGAWDGLCELVGVDPELAGRFAGIGAQYVWQGMPASIWEEIAQLSIKAYSWLKTVPAPGDEYAVQAWCAEMYVTQLIAIREGWEPRTAPELSMVWAGDSASGWETAGVFHDAGIVERTPGHFCKLTYQRSPFFEPIDDISDESASARYVEWIRATEETWPDLCRAFGETGTPETLTTGPAGDEAPDYLRTRIPDLTLLRPHGSERTLHELTREHAVLLVFVPTSEPGRTTTLTLLPHWHATLPGVAVVPVLHDALRDTPLSGLPSAPLFDRDGGAARMFGSDGSSPAAVLLGADGLLAGGPVYGTDAVAGFVADIEAALEEGEGLPESRRAIVTFVDGAGSHLQHVLALRRSLFAVPSDDTDIVVLGPEEVLGRLPDDLVKIPQRPACDDPVWRGYRHVNSIACLNGAGSERLQEYTHLLRIDAGALLFPDWDSFRPSTFRWGTGNYSRDAEVRDNIAALVELHGLKYRGYTPVGPTWYAPTDVVRRTAALAEMLTKYLVTTVFATDSGEPKGWFRGAAALYAGEIAVNHLVADGGHSPELDRFSDMDTVESSGDFLTESARSDVVVTP